LIGILLAGGKGTRLWPLTKVVSKQLLPIHDKPMIYYPLTTLMLSGIQTVVIISSRESLSHYKELLGDGSDWGMNFQYVIQELPVGIPDAFNLVPSDLRNQSCSLILGDNLLYGVGLGSSLKAAYSGVGALAFGYYVSDPTSYGVVELDCENNPISIHEKPEYPKSNYAIPGLYYFDKTVYEKVKTLNVGPRGELEIVDILQRYMDDEQLQVKILERGTTWLDTGTPDDLVAAAEFIRVIEERQGLKIGVPEEVAYRQGFITLEEFGRVSSALPSSRYKTYLVEMYEKCEVQLLR
jgi:glucose-1-phosphate thymidylyltransferase